MNPNYQEILKQIHSYKHEGIRVLIAGLLIKLLIGLFYAYPILYSYHMILLHESTNFTYYLLYPFMLLMMNLAIPHSARVLRYFGYKSTVLMMACAIQISFVLIYFYNLYLLHFALLIMVVSPAIGILYSVPFLSSWKYFIKQKGTKMHRVAHLNSLFQVFTGIGAVIILYIFQSRLDSQLEAFYDQNDELCGECFNTIMREQFKTVGIFIAIIGVAAALLIKKVDDETAETMVDYDLLAFSHLDILPSTESAIDSFDKDSLNLWQSLQTPLFKQITSLVMMSAFIPYMFMAQYQNLQQLLGITYHTSQFNFKIMIVLYGFMRFICNHLTNNIQFQSLVRKYIILMILLLVLLIIGIYTRTQILLQIVINLLIISLAGLVSILTTFIPRLFAVAVASDLYSILLIVMSVSCILSTSTSQLILNYTDKSLNIVLYFYSGKVILAQLSLFRLMR